MPYTSSDIAKIRKRREEQQSTSGGMNGGKWQAADVAKIRRESAAAREGGRDQQLELDKELYTRRTGRPAEWAEPRRTATSARQNEEPGGLLDSLMGMMQRSTELQNQTAYRNQEIEKEGGKLAGRLAAQVLDTTPREGSLADRMERNARGIMDEQESRWREYNEWLEEGSNRELAAAVERMEDSGGQYSLADLAANNDRGWTMEQIEDAAARLADRGLLDKAYSVNRRAGKSVAGIGQEAAGAAAMALPVAAQAVEDVLYGTETRPEEIDGLAGDLYRWGSNVYQRGGENLQESRLGLSDLEELAYGAAESAGENIALGLINPGLLLAEQTARSAGGGIADMAAAGRSAGAAALSGLGHGAISAGIEQIGIGQMMRNMGMRTGMSRAADSILDRIAALPGLDRLAPAVAGTVANAGEEAAEEFVQSYADTALDTLLGAPDTPGLLSGELLAEAAQSALGGAAGGALIGGISTGIGAAQDVRQGRIAPRADLVANANLSATIERAGQVGRAQQAATGAAQAQQERQAAAQVQQAAPEAVTESATTNPQQRAVDPRLAELAAQSGGRLDASAWRTMQQPQAENAETLTAQYQRQAVRQNWTDEQRAEAMLLEANTSMTEAAVNTAVEAMPADVSGDVYSVAANTVYQLSRQGIAEDWDAALDLASRSGVRVNQILAAPGGAEALQMIYNRGQMDGIEAAGYSAAGLADERRAGRVQYQAGALVPEEDKMLFDLYAAASDTAVTVSDRLEKNAGGYVDTALGKVYFGAEAGTDTFGTILHESVHQYNAWDEAGGRELQTATLRYLAEQQGFESVNDLVESYIQRYQEAGQELSYAQACEEITADAMRGVFGSEETFARWVEHQRALAEQNGRQRSTIAKMMDRVREMLDKVISKAKSILNREPGNAAARQAQALAESQKRALEELYYKHAETAMEAQRAARRSQNQTENVNKSEESANENQTGVASSQQNAASSQQNVASEGENVASERRYQLPEESDEERVSRRLANLNAELDDLHRQRRTLREEREAWEESEDVQKLNAEKEAARKHGLFSAEYKAFKQTPQYQAWLESEETFNARAAELKKQIGEVQERVREVQDQLKAISAKNDNERVAYDEAAERNGGKAIYRRTLAVERFGTTEQFERAGYILPDGQMLDFAQNNSTRDTDHREIIDVFGPSEVRTGTEALNAFLADGNIRVMAEAPGIDVPAEVRPSAEQLERIREMAETIGAERRGFTLDFSAPDGKAVASKTYRGRINADRIVREIREYYQTGTLPEESSLAQFRYQLPVDEGQMESGQRAAAWENVDRAGLLEALQAAYEEKETHRVPEETIDRIARRIVSGEDSRADVKVVREQLVGLLNYAASGQADWDAVVAAAEGIADEVMKKSGHMDRSLWNEYKDLHYFTVKVKRGGTEYNELVYRYGSYAAAKREMARFGITLNTNEKNVARGIDQVYQELAGDYPGLFSAELTDPMEQLDRIAQVRQAIKPAYQNSYGESYEEARADLAMRIVGSAVAEGVTDTGVAGMLRQRIDENLNAHRAGIQRRVVNALNEQAREARNEGFAQAQRIVRASGEANRKRLEAERKAWVNTSNAMQEAMARSRNTAQRARDARNKDNVRRAIAANMKTLNRMVFHPNRQNHLSKKLLPDAVRMIEMLNSVTGSADNLTKADGLLAQLNREAKADNGVGGIATDWENSGIFNMMDGLLGDIRERQARMEARAEGHARRLEKSQAEWYDANTEFESLYEEYQGAPRRGSQQVHRMTGLTLDEMVELRDISSALITLTRNQNKLLAVQTQQAASEIGAQAKREVEENPFKLKDNSGKLAELKKTWDANVYNAERMFEALGGYQHEGGAMEALGKALADGEAKKNAIIQKGVQMLGNVLEGEENRKKLRGFSGVDAPLYDFGLRYVDTGEAAKINLAQAASLYKNLQNMQNMYHVTNGGVVIPNMKDYTAGKMKRAFRLKRLAKMENPSETIRKLQEVLSKDEYFKNWIDDSGQILNVYTKGVINGVSVQMGGYEKAKVNDYFPIATDPDALEHQNTGTVYNGTIEGRGFLKERRNRSATPVLLEEIDRVVMRSLSDAAAYGGLAMPVRDANKILNANIYEGGSLMKAIKDNFGEDAVKFIDEYLADLQGQPRTRKSMFEFLDGLRGNYAGAVLTLNLSTIAGQVSGVPAMASELGYGSMGRAWKEMPHILADKKLRENLRKEMTEHGYWQLESTLSTGATAELAELRKKRGAVSWLAEHTPGVNALEWMDEGTRLVGWLGAKDYVDHNLAEYGLTEADVQGEKRSDAWWNAVVSKMTEVNNRTQPNYTVSQMAAIQRNPNQLAKILTMFRSQTFQNYGIVVSAINDVRAQLAYIKDYTKKLEAQNLSAEERQRLQSSLERVQKNKRTALVRLGRAAGSQSLSTLVFIAAGILVKDLFFHKYDRWKDENEEITPQSAASYAFMQWLTNMIEIIPFADTVTSLAANAVSGGQNDPISLSGIDSIGDASLDVYRFITAIQNEDRESGDEAEREAYWQNFYKRAWDASGSLLVLAGVPWGQVQRVLEAGYEWWSDLAAVKNSDGLNLWDVMNAPSSSASQYDRLYTAVFEEPDPEEAAAALKRLADLDELTPPAKASDAKAGDSKLLTELLKREREYGSSVQDAAAARVAGNEAQQRQIRQQLVNTLADAMGIDQNTKEGQRRLRTVINKVDGAITDEVREQMGADSKTGATVYTPLLAALEDGGDPAAAQTVLRRAGITDSNIKSAVQGVYKDEYIYGDESTRQRIERQLLQLKDANGEPYFTKTRDQDDFADWVTDWELQGLNDSVYTDLDEALATGNKAAAKEQIDRYMTAGKSADSIRNRMASLYKQEYINADSARRREIAQFLVGLRGPKGEKIITVDTLTKWIMDDAMAKATAGQ